MKRALFYLKQINYMDYVLNIKRQKKKINYWEIKFFNCLELLKPEEMNVMIHLSF
jgi:hypothetical protein